MPSDRPLLEREMQRLELHPFTLEGFHQRRQRKERNRRIGTAVVALVVAGVALGGLLRAISSGSVPAADPPVTPSEPPATVNDETTGASIATCADYTEVCFGPLEEGTYTSQRFEPALTFTVPDVPPGGWNNPYDTRDVFQLLAPGWSDGWDDPNDPLIYLFDRPGLDVLRDQRPREGCPAGGYATAGTSAIEAVTWVANHPGVSTGAPSPVEVGGLSGYQLDVSIAETWQKSCPGIGGPAGGLAAVPLFDGVTLVACRHTRRSG